MKKLLMAFVCLFALSTLLPAQSREPKEPNLFPVVQEGKWGYIDQTGKLVVKPQFDRADGFSEGRARVKIGKKYGFVDSTGKLLIPARFNAAGDFSEGLVKVMIADKWGFSDKSGRIVIPYQFGAAGNFSEGFTTVSLNPVSQSNRKYFVIDRSGRPVKTPPFNYISEFSEGLAAVTIGSGETAKEGYVNKQWQVVIEPQYSIAMGFSEGLAVVGPDYAQPLVIDKTGQVIIRGYQVSMRGCSEGLISFYRHDAQSGRGAAGFLDKTGQVIIPAKFDMAGDFSGGLAWVQVKSRYGFIDKSGRVAINPQFDNVESFSNGLAAVWVDGKLGYVDKTGQYVWQPRE